MKLKLLLQAGKNKKKTLREEFDNGEDSKRRLQNFSHQIL